MANTRESVRDNAMTVVTGLPTKGNTKYTVRDAIDDGTGMATLMFQAD